MWLGHRSPSFVRETKVFTKEASRSVIVSPFALLPSTTWGCNGQGATLEIKIRRSTDTKPAVTLILAFPTSRTLNIRFPWYRNNLVSGICLLQHKLTKALLHSPYQVSKKGISLEVRNLDSLPLWIKSFNIFRWCKMPYHANNLSQKSQSQAGNARDRQVHVGIHTPISTHSHIFQFFQGLTQGLWLWFTF